MKKTLYSILPLLLLCHSWGTAYGQRIDLKKLDSLISYIDLNNKDIGSISVAKAGREIYARSFGQHAVKGIVQKAPDIRYQIGSITKMLTAIMVFQLVHDHKITLDEKLSAYFPEVPNAGRITIAQVLGHSSGLGDFLTKQDSMTRWLTKPAGSKEIMKEIVSQRVRFAPGDSVRYSNTGYYLLARILEKKYRKNYEQILTQQISSPLGLVRTHSTQGKGSPSDIATPYKFAGGWVPIEDLYFPNVIGVGDVVSTPAELNKIISALFNGKLLGSVELSQMIPLPRKQFGSGLMQIPFNATSFYGHGGDTFGTHSIVMYNPADSLSLALTVNGQDYSTNSLAIAILNIVYNRDLPFPDFNVYTVDPASLSQYEGTYGSSSLPLKIKIFSDGKNLSAQATGQQPLLLEPYTLHRFRKPALEIELLFDPKKGSMTFSQKGRKFELIRQ